MEIDLAEGRVFRFDDEDADLVLPRRWVLFNRAECWYPMTGHMFAHRLIRPDVPTSLDVDHIDGDGLNNHRSNLRPATRSQNLHNSRKHVKSASRFKGVTPDGHGYGGWRALIMVDYRRISLGTFRSEVDAARAYDAAALEYCGEFAATNASLGLLSCP